MYVFLRRLMIMLMGNCLCTIALTSSSANNENNRIDPIVRNLKHMIDTALQQETTSDDINNELLIEQLSRILEEDEGFRILDRQQRSIYPIESDQARVFDGSGEMTDDSGLPHFYSNTTLITFTMGTTSAAFTQYTPQNYPQCPCEKGEPGQKGDDGICSADCTWTSGTSAKGCLGSRINLERLAESIGKLIHDTKKIAYRNAQAMSCVCPTLPPSTTTTMSSVANPLTLDYNTYLRLKGEKGDRGDTGTSCSPTCMQPPPPPQTNVQVFKTLQDATRALPTYPDHTYVHIVDDRGRLQGVFIRVHSRLVPLRIGSENSLTIPEQTSTSTTLRISTSSQCKITLSCPTFHMFALGPYIRRMCSSRRGSIPCSKLSDYDDLCRDVADRQQLKGFYRAFMSSSTQWLSHLFVGTCVNAKIVNMNEQVLFNAYGDIFQQKPPQSEILDVKGSKPEFHYWWHGTSVDGTASSDTCDDWSRQDTSLSGMTSRLPDGINGLFYQQNAWPCSAGDYNMGILCIETNCDKNKNYKN